MKQFLSNLILGSFVFILVVVYSVVKQPTVYSLTKDSKIAQLWTTSKVGVSTPVQSTQQTLPRVVLANGKVLTVEVMKTDDERRQGLSGRNGLADGKGMLFVFESPGIWSMWMKEMKFSIDLLWLDEAGEVVYLVESAPAPASEKATPASYSNTKRAKYVLEVPAGTVAAQGIKLGDGLRILLGVSREL